QDFSKADLLKIFAPRGKVTSAGIYVYQKSKGVSFKVGSVTYDNTVVAASTVKQMNWFRIGSKKHKVQLLGECAHIIHSFRPAYKVQ
ncbi:hypothetical protein PMAYCL1PPCAC_28205, partial [Pristionchus mayeri]